MVHLLDSMALQVAVLPDNMVVVLQEALQVMRRSTSKSKEVLLVAVVVHLAPDMDLLEVVHQAMVVHHHLVLAMVHLEEALLAMVVHHPEEAGAAHQVQATTRARCTAVDNRSRLWIYSWKLRPRFSQTSRGDRMAPSRCSCREYA
jgi:hypothetical protein